MGNTPILGKIRSSAASPSIDANYGPYQSLQEAYNTLGPDGNGVIAIGLTVGIESNGSIEEYWWKEGTSLSDLVKKNERLDEADGTTGKLGYKVLGSASDIRTSNTIYEIRDDFDLGGTDLNPVTLNIPSSCRLKFSGGIIKNCTISGDRMFIEARDTDHIFSNVKITGSILNEYVTPDWFGAKHDSTTDDTAAVQAALDVNSNVKFVKHNGMYRIEDTLHVTKNYQVIYSDFEKIGTRGAPSGTLLFVPTSFDDIMFSLDSNASSPPTSVHDVIFDNLRIITDGSTEPQRLRGIIISSTTTSYSGSDNTTADKDIIVRNCSCVGGGYFVDLLGRGCEITNNLVAGCSLLRASWDDAYQTGNHPAQCGQRAIRIQNNRLHSIASTETYPAIYIKSGHAMGMVIQNNVWDNGRGVFLGANDELWNIMLTDNLVQLNAFNVSATLSLKGGIYNSIVSNNNFSSYRYYDEDAGEWKGYWANNSYPIEICNIHGSCRNTIFENNHFLLTNRFGFLFTNCTVESSRFVGNYFSFFRDGQSSSVSNAFYFNVDASAGETPLGLNNTVISGNMSWDTDEDKNSYILGTSNAFNAYNNVVEYNKAYKQDGTLVANPIGGNIRFYDSVVTLENGITTSIDMSFAIKSFNPWPVSNGGVVSWFGGSAWMDAYGMTPAKHVGATSERPSAASLNASTDIGFAYFDTTLGKPVYVKAIESDTVTWVDSTGTTA